MTRAASAPALEIRGLAVRYGPVRAVKGVDLRLEGPGLFALLGPSGCGKTSLLRAVAGFEVPAAGTVALGGEVVAGDGRWVEPERRRVGMVFQQGALFPHLTVVENVLYGLKGVPAAADRARAALELVGLPEHAGRYPDELSGGQQQRVALARALAPAPRLILLDEPFANLDAALRQRVREEVRGILAAAHATAVLVTHDQEEALSLADRVGVMEGGRLLQVGAPSEVYLRPASPEVARLVGDGQLVPCQVRGGRAESVLGAVAADGPDGPGLLLLRPEDLAVRPEDGGEGAPGVVVERRYFGHDLLETVALDCGASLKVRRLGWNGLAPGQRVRLSVREGRYPAYSPSAPAGG